MSVPFISVTVTSYNYGKYILRQLNSVKGQSFQDYEIIIADDCSKDNSVSLIETFIEENPQLKIKFIKNEKNIGLHRIRNQVLDAAAGTYIMFCDSDDWMDPDCLEELAREAKRTGADRIISEIRDVDQNGKTLQVQKFGDIPSKWMNDLHQGALYRREIFVKNGIRFENVRAADNFYIAMTYNCYCGRAVFVRKPVYNWFIHTDSASGSREKVSKLTGINMVKSVLKELSPVLSKTETKEDEDLFIYQMIKFYCVSLYHYYRYVNVRETIQAYCQIRSMFREFYPDYQKNPYLTLFKKSPSRKYAQIITWITIKAEKIHCMPALLILYHFVSKFHYFNI